MFRRQTQIRISSRDSNTHSNGGQTLGWKQISVSGSQKVHSSDQIRTASREGTSIDTSILIQVVIHGTIGEGEEHLWDLSDRATIGRIIEGRSRSKNIHLSVRPEERSGWSIVTLNCGGGGSSWSLASKTCSQTRIVGTISDGVRIRAIGPPLTHGIVDSGEVTSDIEVDSSLVVEPRHPDVDGIR